MRIGTKQPKNAYYTAHFQPTTQQDPLKLESMRDNWNEKMFRGCVPGKFFNCRYSALHSRILLGVKPYEITAIRICSGDASPENILIAGTLCFFKLWRSWLCSGPRQPSAPPTRLPIGNPLHSHFLLSLNQEQQNWNKKCPGRHPRKILDCSYFAFLKLRRNWLCRA